MPAQSRILKVDHVELEASAGIDDALRWFYGELCELKEVPWRGTGSGLCFRSERIELRLRFVPNPQIDTAVYRVTIAVRSIEEKMALLDERGVWYERLSGLMFTDRRLGVFDPAGHRVALKQTWEIGPL